MIESYRRKFVVHTMSLIGIVLLAVLAVITVYYCNKEYDDLKHTMHEVVQPLDRPFEKDNTEPSPKMKDAQPPPKPDEPNKTHEGIIAVFYIKSEDRFSVVSDINAEDKDLIISVAQKALLQGDSFGMLDDFDMIFYKTGNESEVKIALADRSSYYDTVRKMIIIMFVVFLISMLVFLFISNIIAKTAVKPLEQAIATERKIVTDISHDLKTPITVVLANNGILKENPNSTIAEQMKWIDSTDTASKNMLNMINEILTLASVDAIGKNTVIQHIDFSNMVMQLALHAESVAYDRGIELETDIDSDIFIRANKSYAERIVSGLIDNACKHEKRSGKIIVSLKEQKRKAVLKVRNTDSVISNSDLPHIFERFYKCDKSRTENNSAGLGLAIVKNMTEAMDGSISVKSSTEIGTEFTVLLSLRGEF